MTGTGTTSAERGGSVKGFAFIVIILLLLLIFLFGHPSCAIRCVEFFYYFFYGFLFCFVFLSVERSPTKQRWERRGGKRKMKSCQLTMSRSLLVRLSIYLL